MGHKKSLRDLEYNEDPHSILEEIASDTVADYGALRADFKELTRNFRFAMNQDIAPLLLIQSVLGHAQNGHTENYEIPHPNTTMKDICLAIGRDPTLVAEERQKLIDHLETWIFSGEDRQTPVDLNGNPLFGIDYFDSKLAKDYEFTLDMKKIKKGFVLGALMDSWDIRKKINEKFGKKLGGGKYHFIDMDMLNLAGYNTLNLSTEGHEDVIDTFRDLGVIVNDFEDGKNINLLYVRYKCGKGSSDDAAIIHATRKYGNDEGIGVLLADATDTWDKFCSRPSVEGHDERIAKKIMKETPKIVSDKEVLEFVRDVCSIPGKSDPDSSQRYFLQIDRKVNQSALEGHMDYAAEKPFEKMIVGFNQIENKKFFDYLTDNFYSKN